MLFRPVVFQMFEKDSWLNTYPKQKTDRKKRINFNLKSVNIILLIRFNSHKFD